MLANIIILVLIGVTGFFTARYVIRKTKKGECPGCSGCPHSDSGCSGHCH